MFFGFSQLHSSLVPLILNVRTGKISPQFHIIFDDKFETVNSLPSGECINKQWRRIFKLDCEYYLDIEFDKNGVPKTSHIPKLDPEWLGSSPTNDDQFHHRPLPHPLPTPTHRPTSTLPTPPTPTTPPSHNPDFSNNIDDDNVVPEGAHAAPEGADAVPEGADAALEGAVRRNPRRQVGNYKDGPAKSRRLPTEGESYEMAFNTVCDWGQPVSFVANRGRSPDVYHPSQKLDKAFIADLPVLQDTWDSEVVYH
ncbi:hypothetical protein ACHAXR_001026, partial [Thalassiosira sp. AJA248-18]